MARGLCQKLFPQKMRVAAQMGMSRELRTSSKCNCVNE